VPDTPLACGAVMNFSTDQRSWSWLYPDASPALAHTLEAAAEATWSYAVYCAWSYLHDQDAASDLMDYALKHVSGYVSRFPEGPSPEKLALRLRSLLKRRARQAARGERMISVGSLIDLDNHYRKFRDSPELEQRVYAQEILERLSPQARAIANWRAMGYSWRVIGSNLGLDHSQVRRAYLREIQAVLNLSPGRL
jgi:DNA-binding NarL/FixJ family response regulator